MFILNNYYKYFSAVAIYYILLFFILLVYLFNFHPDLLNTDYLLNWDARHYFDIKEIGYNDYRVAFFPLFPLFWKLSKFSPLIISIFNGVIFIASLSYLFYRFKFNLKEVYIYSSIPLNIFMFLPYTEAFFFLFSTLALIGIKEKNYPIMYLGLLLAGLTRPTISIYLPALFALIFYIEKQEIKFYIISIVITLIAVLLVFAYQYYETNIPFGFFEAQKKFWNNVLQLPKLPFTTWEGHKILLIDSSALLISFFSGFFALIFILKKLIYKQKLINTYILFSLLYVFGTGLIVLLYRGGSLFSINRFVYASVFIIPTIYFISNFIYQKYFTLKGIITLFFLMNGFFLLSGSYVHIQTFLKYFALSCYLFLYVFQINKNKLVSNLSLTLILISNSLLFCYLYYRFLNNLWVA